MESALSETISMALTSSDIVDDEKDEVEVPNDEADDDANVGRDGEDEKYSAGVCCEARQTRSRDDTAEATVLCVAAISDEISRRSTPVRWSANTHKRILKISLSE